jgi:LEA14-like dessication related protein
MSPAIRHRVIVSFLAALGAGCASVVPLDVLVVAIEPVESTPLEQRMKLGLRIVNPNDRDISATGMSLTLDVNGQPLARGVSSTPITVPRLGEALTEITVGTSLFDLARQVLAIDARKGELSYELDGRLHRGGWRPPLRFEKSGTLLPAPAK